MRQTTAGHNVVHASGVCIFTNLPVTMPQDPIEADCVCKVTFGAMPPSGASWCRLSPAKNLAASAYLRTDGMEAIVPYASPLAGLRAVQVREVAPFAAALQGRITLHASCVAQNGYAHCFVGESGAGKSTFAKWLAAIRWQQICDDLLPVRLHGDTWVVRASPFPLVLAGTYFLERGRPDCDLQITELPQREALLAHLQNGFGELPNSAVWQNQFEAYAAIANNVPSYRLIVPHDASRCSRFASDWADRIGRLVS